MSSADQIKDDIHAQTASDSLIGDHEHLNYGNKLVQDSIQEDSKMTAAATAGRLGDESLHNTSSTQ